MKKFALLLTLGLLTVGTTSLAQDFEKPRSGAKLELTETTLSIVPGGEIEFDIWVNRSKRASRTKILAPTFSGSESVTFVVNQDESNPDHYIVTAKAATDAKGSLTYIVNSKTIGYHQISGKMISLKVKNSTKLISQQDN